MKRVDRMGGSSPIRLACWTFVLGFSKVALKNSHEITNNMAEANEIKQLEPTVLKQGGKSGTIENIWTLL